mmetsp:Transcript_58926/g.182627  ORF Transcript_58926/g.182627 Transcript_58926/m.182627 type:complete len:246 (+) Transcript_58926:1818-2555(+)
MTTPTAHTSTLWSYPVLLPGRRCISGAMNAGVPTFSVSSCPGLRRVAIPKSASFTFASWLQALPASMAFCGLMSRWQIRFDCRYCMPCNICHIRWTTLLSPSLPSHCLAASSRLPPSHSSKTMKYVLRVSMKSTSCTNHSLPLHSRMSATSDSTMLRGTLISDILRFSRAFTATGAPPRFRRARQTVPKAPWPRGRRPASTSQSSSSCRPARAPLAASGGSTAGPCPMLPARALLGFAPCSGSEP